jgi:hypothetical protein
MFVWWWREGGLAGVVIDIEHRLPVIPPVLLLPTSTISSDWRRQAPVDQWGGVVEVLHTTSRGLEGGGVTGRGRREDHHCLLLLLVSGLVSRGVERLNPRSGGRGCEGVLQQVLVLVALVW